jgi:hypothetical protein
MVFVRWMKSLKYATPDLPATLGLNCILCFGKKFCLVRLIIFDFLSDINCLKL